MFRFAGCSFPGEMFLRRGGTKTEETDPIFSSFDVFACLSRKPFPNDLSITNMVLCLQDPTRI
jgi:hypothetical protein